MARQRLTVAVIGLKAKINQRIALSESVEARKALCSILEDTLFDANAYGGFRHLYWASEGGYEAWVAAGRPEDTTPYLYANGATTDDYRRFYL